MKILWTTWPGPPRPFTRPKTAAHPPLPQPPPPPSPPSASLPQAPPPPLTLYAAARLLPLNPNRSGALHGRLRHRRPEGGGAEEEKSGEEGGARRRHRLRAFAFELVFLRVPPPGILLGAPVGRGSSARAAGETESCSHPTARDGIMRACNKLGSEP
ncbi:hypothetical protein PVAP13_8NG088006 [Panicum virgatum]|uniref:Uncharacterized protein n=1 Tax=Panicum virgatum TaxID=38727 RepID=A0A8T0P2Z9_PANVG|nr:hypothetical protein PVAP13_8NG189301 [Panicum virgatum]KAG2556427.1 hypothetical protein PVAP13_8NG088006 [Panicum virgatum]